MSAVTQNIRSLLYGKYFLVRFYFLIAVLSQCVLHGGFVECVTVEQDLTLSRNEKLALDKFRAEVLYFLPDQYMTESIYLIRWLRAKNFNLAEAKGMLLENLRWRKANNMSTIHLEDWSGDMEEEYPYFVDTTDKEGRPIATLRFGEWNIRQAVLTSRGPRLTRYLYKALDEVTTKIRTLQGQGRQVTQWVSLLDMDGYALATHGCIQCLGIYISYVTAYESYFPGSVHDIILINTPSIFETVLSLTKPLLRESTRNMLHVFGTNRKQWESYLLRNIEHSQLERHFGGTKIRP